jgi:hypothetical protein
MIALADTMQQRFGERYAGATRPVLWEHVTGATEDGFVNVGYTDNYIRVSCIDARVLTGSVLPAHLTTYDAKRQQMQASLD